jgi:hypothetical protein
MSVGLALGAIGCGSYGSIRTKADAMKFALEGTAEYRENGKVYNYDKAKELFEFFCANVPIMETDVVPIEEILDTAFEKVKEYADWLKESKEKAG